MRTSEVRESMSRELVPVSWDSPMDEAAELMAEFDIRHLPVVDTFGIVVGILSDRDVKRAMDPAKPEFRSGCRAGEFMSWPVATVNEGCSVRDAAMRMVEEKISAFLVTNARKETVGIVTSEDLLRKFVEMLSDPGLPKIRIKLPVMKDLLPEL